jgi:hypothetical protein
MVKKAEQLTPALQAVKNALTVAMDDVEPKIRAELQAAYRADADRQFKRLMEGACAEAAAPSSKGERLGGVHHWSYQYWNYAKGPTEDEKARYKIDTGEYWPHHDDWELMCKYPQYYRVDYYVADRSAKWAVENARMSFVGKNVSKFGNVLAARTDAKSVKIDFRFRSGVFEGSVIVELGDAKILASIGLKYVVRTVPNLTPYFQYPLLFSKVEVGGKAHRGASEAEARELLGGGAAPTKQEVLATKGYCPGSGQAVPSEVYKKIYMLRSPYATCPVCGVGTSAAGGKFRAHLGTEAARAAYVERGFCTMGGPVRGEPVPAGAAISGYEWDPETTCPSCGKKKTRIHKDKTGAMRFTEHKIPKARGAVVRA